MTKIVKYTSSLWVKFPTDGEFTLPDEPLLSESELKDHIYELTAEGWLPNTGAVEFDVKDIKVAVTEVQEESEGNKTP